MERSLQRWITDYVGFRFVIVATVTGAGIAVVGFIGRQRNRNRATSDEVDYRELRDASQRTVTDETPTVNETMGHLLPVRSSSVASASAKELCDQGSESFSTAITLWERSLAACQAASSPASSSATDSAAMIALAQQLRSTLRQAYFVQDVIQHIGRKNSNVRRHRQTVPDGSALTLSAKADVDRLKDDDNDDRHDNDDNDDDDDDASSADSFVSASVDFSQVEREDIAVVNSQDPDVLLAAETTTSQNALYHEGLALARANSIPCRSDRTSILHCKSKRDFLAKLYGVRKAFDTLLQSHDIRCYMAESGKNLVTAILKWAKEDFRAFETKYDALVAWISDRENWSKVEEELGSRGVPSFTFYDIVLDFVLLDAFEDAENPPSTVVTILGNRWLTQGFKRSAFTTAVWSVIKAKKRLVKVSGGFMSHFYEVMEHVSPIMAWGLLGPDRTFAAKITLVKDQVLGCLQDVFSIEKSNYSSASTLAQDILSQLKRRMQATLSELSMNET